MNKKERVAKEIELKEIEVLKKLKYKGINDKLKNLKDELSVLKKESNVLKTERNFFKSALANVYTLHESKEDENSLQVKKIITDAFTDGYVSKHKYSLKDKLSIAVNIRLTKTAKSDINEMSNAEMGRENISGWITMMATREYNKFKKLKL